MKFKNSLTKEEYSPEKFTERELTDVMCSGSLENVNATVDNILESYSRLLGVLADKGILNKGEIFKIVRGFTSDDID